MKFLLVLSSIVLLKFVTKIGLNIYRIFMVNKEVCQYVNGIIYIFLQIAY